MRADVLGRKQKCHAFPSGIDNKPGLRFRRGGQHHARPDWQSVHGAPCLRAERDIGEQAFMDARTCSQAKVARIKHDHGGPKANNHAPCLQRLRLKLHRILVDQLDACVDSRGVVDVFNRDRSLGYGERGGHYFHVLRNFDRRSGWLVGYRADHRPASQPGHIAQET